MTLDVMSEWDPASGLAAAAGIARRIPVGQGSSFSHGAWFAVVAVHPDFGLVRVRRLAGAFAAGRILNEKTAASQMRGGAIMGIGQALLEATSTDGQTARILNPGLNEYLVPAHADVPLIDVAFIKERDENINVLGVKGIGELPVSGFTPAIANAVHHATGGASSISRFGPTGTARRRGRALCGREVPDPGAGPHRANLAVAPGVGRAAHP